MIGPYLIETDVTFNCIYDVEVQDNAIVFTRVAGARWGLPLLACMGIRLVLGLLLSFWLQRCDSL